MPRRNVLRSQARQMIHQVLKYMKQEARRGLQFDIKAAQKRTAAATGVSLRLVQSIARAANAPGASLHDVFRTPGRRRKGKKKVTALDSQQRGIIKRCIHKFHITEKALPTVEKLTRKLKQTIDFKGSSTSLRRILKQLGFKWKRVEDKRQVLIERSHIRLKRIDYLQAITAYRQEGRPVVFADASFVEIRTRTVDDNCQSKNRDRVMIIHAASDNGFLPNTLVIYKTSTKSDNSKIYDTWLRMNLIPNLPEYAVVVVGNAPYLNKLEEAIPTSTSKRIEMETWLFEKGIPFKPDTLKPLLYKTVCAYKDCFKKYKIDNALAENNHPVLRFPAHDAELNPLELAWTLIKRYVTEKNGGKTVQSVRALVLEKVMEMQKEFSDYCREIKKIEDEYQQNDLIIDRLTDDVTVHVSDNESDMSEDSGSEFQQNDDSSSDDDLLLIEDLDYFEREGSPDVVID